MIRYIFICLFGISAFAQQDAEQDVIQVIRVQDVMPLLSSLINSGRSSLGGAAEQLAEFVPIGNLQGTLGAGVNSVVEAVKIPISAGTSTGVSLMKGFAIGKQIPVIGTLFPSLNTYMDLKESPEVPTLPPMTPPEDVARLAADLGIKSAAVKNAWSTVVSIPTHAIANGAQQVATAFEDTSNEVLGIPDQINQLLQFQHSLFESYLAGFNQASTAVPSHTLRRAQKVRFFVLEFLSYNFFYGGYCFLLVLLCVLSLTMIQPHLTNLLNQFENPSATGALASLGKAFAVVRVPNAESTNVSESLPIDPTSMKLAFANIVLNFLQAVTGAEGEQPGSDA